MSLQYLRDQCFCFTAND